MTERLPRPLLLSLLLTAACAELPPAAARPARIELHVTSGAITHSADGELARCNGSVRAQLSGKADAAELRFVYRGPSASAEPLASGELRRQIGIKLRARDTCNVVYVMWQIEPRPGLEVSVKYNPELHTHAECRDHGYQFVGPDSTHALPAIVPDAWHVLRAELRGRSLRVWTDGIVAWSGTLPDTALRLEGPAGLRTDNGRFELHLEAP
jgi:hypothetical protein